MQISSISFWVNVSFQDLRMKVLKLFWVTRHVNFEHKNDLQMPAVPPSSGSTAIGKQWVMHNTLRPQLQRHPLWTRPGVGNLSVICMQ